MSNRVVVVVVVVVVLCFRLYSLTQSHRVSLISGQDHDRASAGQTNE